MKTFKVDYVIIYKELDVQVLKVAFKAIIRKDDKILVIKRSAKEDVFEQLWDIPGGRMSFGEMPKEALTREIKEETGLTVNILNPFTVWSFMASEDTQVVGITMLADYVSGTVSLSEEHTEYKWIYPEEFEQLDAHKNLKKEILLYARK